MRKPLAFAIASLLILGVLALCWPADDAPPAERAGASRARGSTAALPETLDSPTTASTAEVASNATAQSPPVQTPAGASPEIFTVRGRVLTYRGQPAPLARVTVGKHPLHGSLELRCDAQGQFEFECTSDMVELSATSSDQRQRSRTAGVGFGPQSQPYELVLVPNATLRVHVLGELRGVRLEWIRLDTPEPHVGNSSPEPLVELPSTEFSDPTIFEAGANDPLPNGRYEVAAVGVNRAGEVCWDWASVTLADKLVVVSLKPQPLGRVDVQLQCGGQSCQGGVLALPLGRVLPDGWFGDLWDRSRGLGTDPRYSWHAGEEPMDYHDIVYHPMTTDEAGQLTLRLPAGRWRLLGLTPGVVPMRAAAEVRVEPGTRTQQALELNFASSPARVRLNTELSPQATVTLDGRLGLGVWADEAQLLRVGGLRPGESARVLVLDERDGIEFAGLVAVSTGEVVELALERVAYLDLTLASHADWSSGLKWPVTIEALDRPRIPHAGTFRTVVAHHELTADPRAQVPGPYEASSDEPALSHKLELSTGYGGTSVPLFPGRYRITIGGTPPVVHEIGLDPGTTTELQLWVER